MLDLAKIQSIAQSYSPQELFAALVWQRQFNEFDIHYIFLQKTKIQKFLSFWT